MQANTLTIQIQRLLLILFGILSLALGCKKVQGIDEPKQSPLSIFDEVWNIMNKRYALFAIKGLNWDSTGKSYRDMVTNDMSNGELFTIIANMLSSLKDGHIALISPSSTANYQAFYTDYPRNFNFNNIIDHYLNNNYSKAGPLLFKVENDIGYIYYNSFYAAISDEQLDILIAAMKSTKGLIIDIRNNTGGNVSNAVRFCSRFISTKKLVKYEVFKNGPGKNEFAQPAPYYISPSGTFYSKPVCLLLNRACYSTCNDFVLYMSGLPNIRMVGDQTGGGGGIPNNYLLANGWKLQLTTSVTLSPAKTSVENGIQATFSASINAQQEASGKDPILEKAIQLLQ